MCNQSCPNNVLKLCFPVQETEECKQASEKNHLAWTPVQILYELYTLPIIIFLETIIESPFMERDTWEHLDPTLKVGFFFPPLFHSQLETYGMFYLQATKTNQTGNPALERIYSSCVSEV